MSISPSSIVPSSTVSAPPPTPTDRTTSNAPSISSATPTASSTSSSTAVVSSTPVTTTAASSSSSVVSLSSSIPSSTTSTTTSTTAAAPSLTTTAPTSTAPPTTSSPSARSSSSSSFTVIVQTSNGQVFTRTSVVTVPFTTPTQSPSGARSSTSFFHNTGAVAGVFSVVGVVAIVALFFLLTSFIRRRRARKFDREIDEAAAAAAAAQAPDFDDYDFNSGTGYGPYSETSHGTYHQPPLSHEPSHNHNNLGDVPAAFDPFVGLDTPAAGAAGIGARGRSLRDAGQDPYGALANPPEQYEMYERRQSWNQGIPHGAPGAVNYDLLQAAGLNEGDPYAVTRGPSTRLAHSQSKSRTVPTPAPGYPSGQDMTYPAEKARYSASYPPPAGGSSTMPPDIDDDEYSVYEDQPSPGLDNPYSPRTVEDERRDVPKQSEGLPEDAARASLADDEDYGYSSGHRVLRVANA
ncbi:hypothetical protein F5148DRAFT_355993 [Russula earlei]|uniref:Uncharacterized protein n=1 Tax=Russula earlei TaxID=71964 RepID=A0ACC0UJT1_9AGAM|nr:hypothetical protein F5148DRAFT_355993 [Russula earlei]